MGEIHDLVLPRLSEMSDFHPPPLAKVFRILHSGPNITITLDPTSGVPSSCLEDFLHAVDNHIDHLEEDLDFHVHHEVEANRRVADVQKNINVQLSKEIKALGCRCDNPSIRLNGSISSFQDYMGVYHYEGLHQVRIKVE